MAVYQKKNKTQEVVKNSPPHTLDLPPTSSPKLKAMTKQRVHELGCPPIMHFREQI